MLANEEVEPEIPVPVPLPIPIRIPIPIPSHSRIPIPLLNPRPILIPIPIRISGYLWEVEAIVVCQNNGLFLSCCIFRYLPQTLLNWSSS